METVKFAKQTLNFQKSIFENSFNAMVMLQDQSENIFNGYIDKLPWTTEEGKKTLQNSMNIAKKARDDFKRTVIDGFVKFEQLLQETEQ